jgi:hypothetical protein
MPYSPKSEFTKRVVDKADQLKNNVQLTNWETAKFGVGKAIGSACESLKKSN